MSLRLLQRSSWSPHLRTLARTYTSSSRISPSRATRPAPSNPFAAATGGTLAGKSSSSNVPLIEDDARDWSRSFHGLSTEPFSEEVASKLLAPINPKDIEVKPDGLIYLPEIKYRRILNSAFGPGGWGLAPRSEHSVSSKTVSREYALVALGRFVSQARGEQDYFDPDGLATASEGCKSNALMRCCKDLGIASELWDPSFIRSFKAEHAAQVMTEHFTTQKRRMLWRRKDGRLEYPYKEL
ncbi:mitochondrial genome maintenance protein Mgm101 [Piptocephalis cylindrospora]|uniref:Mitochondrial genome maintenance protein MGM101 n=1 Tax=Piptocephalis cylindrospora TaxID=1907219 RepID=A0A4P9Y2A9_9FUNG|nr:mitochondrial genome maintenance protein Mgm101 [Piptocephalis cylindrospora]|eukprot:RKP13008.1 mitochondrial genome maintenance protein Mgm101 [Piptocephalis cylindrospora]